LILDKLLSKAQKSFFKRP